MGIVELFEFYRVADKKQIRDMERVLDKGDWEAYKKIIFRVLKVKLV